MATKNLARTVIEGGRCGYYQMEVAKYAAKERAELRAFAGRVTRHPEQADEVPAPKRRPVHVCFSDKLSPAYRFLEASCGRPWSKVRGELFARFDIRTTPGRHILFDHVLPEVEEDRRWRPRFSVDAHGILRRAKKRARTRGEWFDSRPVFRWIGDRRVRRSGERFAWWVPAKRDRDEKGRVITRWRASGLLSDDEEKYLRSLPEDVIERVLAHTT